MDWYETYMAGRIVSNAMPPPLPVLGDAPISPEHAKSVQNIIQTGTTGTMAVG